MSALWKSWFEIQWRSLFSIILVVDWNIIKKVLHFRCFPGNSSSKLLYITPGISCFCYIEWGTEKHHIHASVFPTWRDLVLNFELILPTDVIAQHPTVKNLLSSLDPHNRDSKLKISYLTNITRPARFLLEWASQQYQLIDCFSIIIVHNNFKCQVLVFACFWNTYKVDV